MQKVEAVELTAASTSQYYFEIPLIPFVLLGMRSGESVSFTRPLPAPDALSIPFVLSRPPLLLLMVPHHPGLH